MEFLPEKHTHRFANGDLVTTARSRVEWSRVSLSGKVHRVDSVIIRWNSHGGTREKPDMTFVMACGPQRHILIPAPQHDLRERCARCDSKRRR